jgi:hypothetical protein
MFIVLVGTAFLTACGDLSTEYSEATTYRTVQDAESHAMRHVDLRDNSNIWFEVWNTDDYAAGGEPKLVLFKEEA